MAGRVAGGVWLAVAGAVLLAAVSWIDDLKRLTVTLRLAVQAGAVILGLIAMDGAGPVFQGLLPPLLDRIAAGLLWLWFINLFNFMDGIDGISGVEAICIVLGLVLIAWLHAWAPEAAAFPALLAAATLGFLASNWAPAKIFLGDVGTCRSVICWAGSCCLRRPRGSGRRPSSCRSTTWRMRH